MKPMQFALVLAFFCSTAHTQTAPPAPQAADFAVPSGLHKVLLSPDGERIAATVSLASGERLVLTQKLDGSERRIAYVAKTPNIDLHLQRWYGADRLLVRVSVQDIASAKVGDQQLPTERMLHLRLDGSQPQLLMDPARELWTNAIGNTVHSACPGAATLTRRVVRNDETSELHRFGTEGGRGARVARALSGDAAYFADAQGQVRVAKVGQGKEQRWWQLKDGRWAAWTPPVPPQAWTKPLGVSGEAVLMLVRLAEGPYRLERWPLAGGEAEVLLADFDGPGVDLLVDGASCEALALQTSGATLTWRPELAPLLGGLAQALPGVRVTQLHGDRYVAERSTDPYSPETLVGDRRSGKLTRLSAAYPRLPDPLPLTSHRVREAGIDFKVTEAAKSGNLTVVCFSCRVDEAFDPLASLLAMRYGRVISPAFSVGGSSPFVSLQRARPALASALRQFWLRTPEARLAFVGEGGMAGQIALLVASDLADYTLAVATRGALTDMQLYAASAKEPRVSPAWASALERRLAPLQEADLASLSPLTQAQALRMPVLLAHEQANGEVGAEHASRLHKKLQELGHPATLLVFQNANSSLSHPPHRVQWFEGVSAVIDKGLQTQP